MAQRARAIFCLCTLAFLLPLGMDARAVDVRLPKPRPERPSAQPEVVVPTKKPAKPSAGSAAGNGLNISKVPLVATEAYDPSKESGRVISLFTSSIGLATFGNLYRLTGMNVESDLLQKLEDPEVKAYFPKEAERRKLAKTIADEAKKKHLSGPLTNEAVIQATRLATNRLVSAVIQRAMEKEGGVKDASRRQAWADKILGPFNACMQKARIFNEGNRCLSPLESDVVKNIGLAIHYEMVRQEIGPAYLQDLPKKYAACLQLKKSGANDRVKPCVLQGMRKAVEAFGLDRIREVSEQEASGSSAAVEAVVKKKFQACLAKAADRSRFNLCADQLATLAGGEISAAAIEANREVHLHFPDAKRRREVAAAGRESFVACMEENGRQGRREGDGSLSTDNCVRQVKLEAAKKVASSLFASSLAEIKGLDRERAAIGKKTNAVLNQCWSSKASVKENDTCMKSAVSTLVGAVAETKLAQVLPAGLVAQRPELKDQLVKSVLGCIKESLPANLLGSLESEAASEQVDVKKEVESCAAKLLKEAALAVADHTIEKSLSGRGTEAATVEELQKKLVQESFASCLGNTPKDADLDRCSVDLKVEAGSEIGRLLFRGEFDRFVDERGGIKAYGLNEAERDKFLAELQGNHEFCLKARVLPGDQKKSDAAVDECSKKSIITLAGFIAQLEFQRRMREHIQNPAELSEFSTRFVKDFSQCLRAKSGSEHSVDEFVANIDTCRLKLQDPYTLEVADRQLAAAAKENLPGITPAERVAQKRLRESLVAEMGDCLKRADINDGKTRDGCADTLKRHATRDIVSAAARAQVQQILRTDSLPKEIQALEQALQACIAGKEDAEACARRHALGVAKQIGSTKLRHSLADTLGASEYAAATKAFTELEGQFYACLDSIPGQKADRAFTQALEACGRAFERRGVRFVQRQLASSLANPEHSDDEAKVAELLAFGIPCLDPVMPPAPFREDALDRIDPKGLLDEVAKIAGGYISYDADKAGQDFETLLAQVGRDLAAAGPQEARRKLLDLLVREGMLDRLLKSMVYAEIQTSLQNLPKDQALAKELEEFLLSRQTLDGALGPEQMAKLRPFLLDKILRPILIEGKSFKDPVQQAAVKAVEQQVANTLLESREFSDELVRRSVQSGIDENNGLYKLVGRWAYGFNTYDWELARVTPQGQAAEAAVREKIIGPLIRGEKLSGKEMEKRKAEVQALVEEALSQPLEVK